MVVVQLEDEGKPPLYGISTALNNRKQGKEFLIDDVEPNMVMASGSPPNNQSKNRILVVVSNQTYFPNEPEVVLREKDASGKTRWEVVLSGEQLEIVKKAVVKFTAPPYLDRDIESDVQVELCLRDKKTNKETKPWPFFYLGSDLYDVRRKAKKRKLTDDDHSGTPTEYSEESKEFKRKAVSVYNGQYQEGAYRSYDTNGESSSSSETQNVLVIGKELSSPALTSLPFSTYKPMSPQPETQSYQELLGVTPSSSMLARPPSAGFNTADNAQTIIITSGAESNTYQVLNSQHDKYPVQAMDDQQGQTVVSSEADNTFTFPPLQPNQQLAIINGQWVIINNDLGEEMPGPSAGPSQPVPAPSLPEHHFQKPMSAPLNHPGRSESQSTRSSAPLLSTEQSTTPSMNMLLSSGLQALLNALTAQQPQQLQQPLQQQPQQTQAPAQQPTQQQPQTPVQQPIQQQQQQPAFFTPEQTQAFLQNLLTMYQTQLAQSSAGTPGNVASMAQSQSNEGSVMSDSDLETDGAHSQNNGLQSRTRSGKTIQAAGKPVPATRVTRGKKMYENMSGFSKPAGS
ncbi:uncharacterized protein LOC127868948 [Dreissena polymorpha]|nr:uncharacterized protein LOC127868948 [Dreissena polymorpha]